ncbi:MAG: hypothetical protein J5449_05020, partial [Oscillospiraceae bacterium]|nr:hypothetical protein [Oscillospiraceae bacterium]
VFSGDDEGEENAPEVYHLILCDGASLTLNSRLFCNTGGLAFYGQSAGTGELRIGVEELPDDPIISLTTFVSLTVCGGSISVRAADDAVEVDNYGEPGVLSVLGGTFTAFSTTGYGLKGSLFLSGGAANLSSVSENAVLKANYTDGTTLYPQKTWKKSNFNKNLAGKLLRPVAVSGVWSSKGKLIASFTAPVGSQLIAAVYDDSGRLNKVVVLPVDSVEPTRLSVGLSQTDGVVFKLMLTDTYFIPLCKAWTGAFGAG